MNDRTRFNCKCQRCGHIWTAFWMPMSADNLRLFAKGACPKCCHRKPLMCPDQTLEERLATALARAIEAMARPAEKAILETEWDQIIVEGRELLGDQP